MRDRQRISPPSERKEAAASRTAKAQLSAVSVQLSAFGKSARHHPFRQIAETRRSGNAESDERVAIPLFPGQNRSAFPLFRASAIPLTSVLNPPTSVLPHRVVNFSPTMPATISTMHVSRAAVAGSLNSTMPAIAVPIAPIPVQIA